MGRYIGKVLTVINSRNVNNPSDRMEFKIGEIYQIKIDNDFIIFTKGSHTVKFDIYDYDKTVKWVRDNFENIDI